MQTYTESAGKGDLLGVWTLGIQSQQKCSTVFRYSEANRSHMSHKLNPNYLIITGDQKLLK